MTSNEHSSPLVYLPTPAPQTPSLILDVGCGSGLSGDSITSAGHHWIDVARRGETEGDLMLADMGRLLRFRPGSFDGAISVSAVQWLCNADKKSHVPYQRLTTFFKWLYSSLTKGARAALQFYPENAEQLEMITSAALRSGFGGSLVIDFPNSTKAKKYLNFQIYVNYSISFVRHFLVLWAGFTGAPPTLPQGLTGDGEESNHVTVAGRETNRAGRGKKTRRAVKDRSWVLRKKENQRRLGKDVRLDTKYTGRKRSDRF